MHRREQFCDAQDIDGATGHVRSASFDNEIDTAAMLSYVLVWFHQATSMLPEPWPPHTERKEKKKTTPFSVDLMRSQGSYRAAQVPHTYVLCSNKAPQEPSSSVQPATAQPSIQLHASPAAAAALATSLAGLVKGHSWPGYQLLGQLALVDIQDGNERVTGIAQHVMSCTLKVGCACQAFAQVCPMLLPCTLHMPDIRLCLRKTHVLPCAFVLISVLVSCSAQSILGLSQTAMMHAADSVFCRINHVWW